MNRGRSRAAGVALAPRFQMFLWTRVQVRGWGKARDIAGNQMETKVKGQGGCDVLSRESQGKTSMF